MSAPGQQQTISAVARQVFVRIRVRGVFPRAGSTQFIPEDVVFDARQREPEGYENAAVVMGVDVARFGDPAAE